MRKEKSDPSLTLSIVIKGKGNFTTNIYKDCQSIEIESLESFSVFKIEQSDLFQNFIILHRSPPNVLSRIAQEICYRKR